MGDYKSHCDVFGNGKLIVVSYETLLLLSARTDAYVILREYDAISFALDMKGSFMDSDRWPRRFRIIKDRFNYFGSLDNLAEITLNEIVKFRLKY